MWSQLLFPSKSLLAEGLHWDSRRSLLWFVDIESKELCSLDIDIPSIRRIKVPEKIGWVITEKNNDNLIIGLKSGIASINPDNDEIEINWITKSFPTNEKLRLNDAKADPLGCIWMGSLNDENQNLPEGVLARINRLGSIKVFDSGYKVTNGPAIDPQSKRFLHTDSLRRTIYEFDINFETSELSNKRVWKVFEKKYGFPDGMCFDSDGNVWVANWGVGLVTKLDANSDIVKSVKIPSLNVSNVCFAGSKMDRLIVTTASEDKTFASDQNRGRGAIFEIVDHKTSGAKVYSSNIF